MLIYVLHELFDFKIMRVWPCSSSGMGHERHGGTAVLSVQSHDTGSAMAPCTMSDCYCPYLFPIGIIAHSGFEGRRMLQYFSAHCLTN